MKDLKECITELGYGEQWQATQRALAKERPPHPEQNRCVTQGCPNEWIDPNTKLCTRCNARRHKVQTALKTIPECYRWCTFEAPELPRRCGGQAMVDKAAAALEALAADKAPAVVFQGTAGSGKTVLATAMLRRWSESAFGMFVDALDIGRCYRNAALGKPPEEMTDAKRSQLVVLDDVGGEPPSGNDAVGELIHARHASGRPTIYTLGFDRAELVRLYGSGITRRIFDRAIVLTWPAERKAAA